MNITIHIGTWIIPVIITVVYLIIWYIIMRREYYWGLGLFLCVFTTIPAVIVCWVTWLLMTIFK